MYFDIRLSETPSGNSCHHQLQLKGVRTHCEHLWSAKKFTAYLRMVLFERYKWSKFMTSEILVRGHGSSWQIEIKVWIWTSENHVVYIFFVQKIFQNLMKIEIKNMKWYSTGLSQLPSYFLIKKWNFFQSSKYFQ